MIDIHTHLGRGVVKDEPPVDEDELLRRMDELGLEQAVVLARGVSPECAFFHFTTEDVLAAYRRHPDRFIPFYKADPRNGANSPDTDFSWVLEHYRAAGCRAGGRLPGGGGDLGQLDDGRSRVRQPFPPVRRFRAAGAVPPGAAHGLWAVRAGR